MKKIFKKMGLIAVAGALTLQTGNVLAEELSCPAGTTKYTDYYLFLYDETAKYFEDNITDDKGYEITTSSTKKNNIGNVGEGNFKPWDVPIVGEGDQTTTCKDGVGECTPWTVEEYWQHAYDTWKYIYSNPDTQDAKDSVYRVGTTNYIASRGYVKYDSNGAGTAYPEHKDDLALMNYIAEHYNNLGESDLVRNGTSLPDSKTSFVLGLGSSEAKELTIMINRKFNTTDKKAGIELDGQTLVYAPAVSAVTYCKADSTTEETKKSLTYDSNADGDQVTNMPNPATVEFTDKCTDIDTTIPTRDGYKFLYWTQNKDGSGTKYGKGYETSFCSENGVIYAQWEKIEHNADGSYTVTYDANGGKNAPSSQNGKDGECIKISEGKPTKSNAQFLGWSTKKDATMPDEEFAAGKEYCGKDGNITLYAVWSGKTGISTHLIAFGSAALIAVGALIVAKKKDLFKQI